MNLKYLIIGSLIGLVLIIGVYLFNLRNRIPFNVFVLDHNYSHLSRTGHVQINYRF